jgi:flagellar hook protein FlgE
MSQGNISATGQDLDVAIDGSGYFTLNNGTQDVYTRIGSFGIDSQNTLVDPATGYKVQRMGTTGESDGFQISGDSSISIPWDAAMRDNPTSSLTINGNLRSSAEASAATTLKLTSDLAFTTGSGVSPATTLTAITSLDQFENLDPDLSPHGAITITGVLADGTTPLAAATYTVTSASTVQNVLDWISGKFATATATLNSDGEIVLTGDSPGGYSQAMITDMDYLVSGDGETFSVPTYFDLTTVGGNDSKTFNITVYDPLGNQHVLDGVFVKTDTANTWDLVIPSISGEVAGTWASYDFVNSSTFNRRISGIQFGADGSYAGLVSPSESLTIGVQFTAGVKQSMTLDLGTINEFTGLTQFDSSQSSAAAMNQNGYEAGTLASVSIDADGTVVGTFTNGVKADVAAIQLATFQNPNGLEAVGSGYYLPTANSGSAVATMAASGGAGSLTSKSLEMSNVDVANQFVNLMQAQNGFQSNARTIRVANDLLRELTNLIR